MCAWLPVRMIPSDWLTGHGAMSGNDATVTQLLRRASDGDKTALDTLVELLYTELHSIAQEQRARWRGDDTLSATVLVNEAYVRLAKQDSPGWETLAHFKAVAATAMRQIMVSYARRRSAKKRGGDEWNPLTLERVEHLLPALGEGPSTAEAVIGLDDALTRLEEQNPDYRRIVECRFFGGMTIEETAEALGLSPSTVKRRWNLARAWLHRELDPE